MAESIVADTQQNVIEDVVADAGDVYGNLGDSNGNMQMPSVDEIWKMIEQMDGISDEERATIRENLYNPPDGTAEDFLRRMGAQAATAGIVHSKFDYMIFFAMIAILVLVFALFGYKLYKSLMEKELKKQEKQKLKQSKKSKKAN